jgi:hypothetical protein
MHRRTLAIAVITAAFAATVWTAGAEQATFILTSGQRVNGPIAAHGRAGTNFRPQFSEFSVGTTDGLEIVIPVERVAVIDFAGGTPGNDELARLQPGEHTLTLRDGADRTGRLVDFLNGMTIRWQNANGRREDIPIAEAARIYIEADAARRLYGYRPTIPRGVGGGTGRGVFSRSLDGVELDVRGGVPWTNTGLRVTAGDTVRFQATGEVFFMRTDTATAGPDGDADMRRNSYPVRAMGVGGLIARVANGTPFPIGSNQQPIRMPATGALQLGINDDNFADNSGAFRVIVRR